MPAKYRKIKIGILIGLGILCLLPVLLFILVYCGAFGKVYSKEELKNIQNYQATEVYSEDAKMIGNYYLENRSCVNFKHVPHFLIEELISTEDARFYEHNGVDFQGLLRVFFKTLLMGDKKSGGGSTIGQQLSKNLFKRKNHGILSMPVNKMKEAIHAMRLHEVYNQEEILVLYLNTVSMGEDTYGIKNSSMRFFSKPQDSLTIEEGAVLIGMLKSPTLYNPRLHPDIALKRRNTVLDNMADHGYISKQKAESLKSIPLQLQYKNTGIYGEIAPYFLKHIEELATAIVDSLKTKDGKKYNFYTDGLKITTTLNYQMQEYALKAMKEHMKYLQDVFDKEYKIQNPLRKNKMLISSTVKKSNRYKTLIEAGVKDATINKIFKTPIEMEIFDWDGGHKIFLSPLDSLIHSMTILQTGFLAMEPNTGDIKVWIGGNDYSYFQYDHVKSKRQIGSTFKPIVYATAIEHGASPCKFYDNEQKVYEQFAGWSPGNSNGKYGGKYSMKGALINSINVVSVEVLLQAGIGNVIQTAHQLGIKSKIPYLPAIALGVADISLMEMVKAYCAFPNGGRAVETMPITKIEDKNGRLIWSSGKHKKGKQVFKNQTAYYITEMLKGVINEGTASRLRYTYHLKGEMAGKTGTSQYQADGWFIGYTPGLVAGAWVGAESPKVHFRSTINGQGAAVALPIWGLFMQQCKADKKLSSYTNGSFHFGNGLSPMPECESFQEDNVFGKIRKWFIKKSDKQKNKKANQKTKEK
jgi:penicillin-binding protein 1A